MEVRNKGLTWTTFPVLGHDTVVSVLMSNPFPQHDRDSGPFAQDVLAAPGFNDDAPNSALGLPIDSAETVELSAINNTRSKSSMAAVYQW